MGKDKKLSALLEKSNVLKQETKTRLKEQAKLFNTEERGYLEVEQERERTLKVNQAELKDLLPVQAAQNIFDLNMPDYGPYGAFDVTKNGRHLILGGKKGHLSLLDWKRKDLVCEFQAKQLIRDVKFLHNEQMYAVAQKKYLHIYDSSGIELHCLRDILEPKFLDFLPYHFLLASASKLGHIQYLDISIGKTIADIKTKRGEPLGMQQNVQNAVIATAHTSGEVMMWTPNMGSKPVVTMLAHPSSPVTALALSRCGRYLATAGKDSKFKIFDIRNTYQSIHTYFSPSSANTVAFSDTGLLAVGFGNEVQVWKNSASEKQKAPYMKHRIVVNQQRSQVGRVRFLPFEDVLGIGHDLGYSSIVVPGSGEATFDAFEANPFATAKQRQEAEVHGLLQKLQPESISLQVESIGKIDTASKDIKEKEEREIMEKAIQDLKKKDKKKNKMRGKGKTGREMENKTHQLHETMREKNKLLYKREYDRNKIEQTTLGEDIEFLDKINTTFDPLEAFFKSGAAISKRQKF